MLSIAQRISSDAQVPPDTFSITSSLFLTATSLLHTTPKKDVTPPQHIYFPHMLLHFSTHKRHRVAISTDAHVVRGTHTLRRSAECELL